jgi:ABC-2 type transport system ATP-binding protein
MKTVFVHKLSKNFKDKEAVSEVSFNIAGGEVFGLLGPNGAGKTTVISMLTTLLRPTSGNAAICGYDIVREDKKVRRSIGLVFQETILDEDLTAYSNLDTHARLYRVPRAAVQKRIRELMKIVGLEAEIKNKVANFSGGMKRRLEIARGLIHRPRVLFLDEPTIGLDPKTRRLIWEYIKKLRETTDITILLTTHYLEEADALCDRVAIMNNSKIVVTGTPHDLKKDLGGDLIRIELDREDQSLLSKIRSLPYVQKVKFVDKFINLTVDNGEQRAVELIPLINKYPPTLKSMNLREPTLDDVFLYHTGEHFEYSNQVFK